MKLSALVLILIFSLSLRGKEQQQEPITLLPLIHKSRVALTFDACESKDPAFFDEKILKILKEKKIPFTIFVTGRFLKRNSDEIKALVNTGLVEFENHSMTHYNFMQKLSPEKQKSEVLQAEKMIYKITGRKPTFFRFPGGNFNDETLQNVLSLGYKVVHWTFPSGDPDPKISKDRLIIDLKSRIKSRDILIYHINGKGVHTSEALNDIIDLIEKRGLKFVKLQDAIK